MSLPEPRWLCGSWEWVRTGQIHLPGGWSRGGLCGSGSAAAACWAPCPPASFGLTSSLRSAGLFKISSMEKDRPSFFGASQHPGLFLSIPQWRGGCALAPSAGGCVEGGGGLARAPGEASGGRRPSLPGTPGIKRASRGGERGSAWRIIQAWLNLRGYFDGSPQKHPGVTETGHVEKAGRGCTACPPAQSPPGCAGEGVAIAKPGSVLL